MSPGRTALPLIMFSVAPTTPSTRTGASSSASAAIASITAAPPHMSNFMSVIELAGLIARPPLSNVTALPISASRGVLGALGLVDELDHPRVLVGSLGDGGERTHPALADLIAVEDRDAQRVVAVGEFGRVVGERRRRQVIGRRVGEVAGAVLGRGEHRTRGAPGPRCRGGR